MDKFYLIIISLLGFFVVFLESFGESYFKKRNPSKKHRLTFKKWWRRTRIWLRLERKKDNFNHKLLKVIFSGVLIAAFTVLFGLSDINQKNKINSVILKTDSIVRETKKLTDTTKNISEKTQGVSEKIKGISDTIKTISLKTNTLSDSIYKESGNINKVVVTTGNLLSNTRNLINVNDEITKNFITGGDSYPYARLKRVNSRPYYIVLSIENKGKYPLYELGFTITDLDFNEIDSRFNQGVFHVKNYDKISDSLFQESMKEERREHNIITYNRALPSGMSWIPDSIPINLTYMSERKIKIHLICRNYNYTEFITFRRNEGYYEIIRDKDKKIMLDTTNFPITVLGGTHINFYEKPSQIELTNPHAKR